MKGVRRRWNAASGYLCFPLAWVIFSSVPDEFTATRYHSLVVERSSLPACLAVTAESEDGEIMGVRHRGLPLEGVQFHPEALLTEHGHRMLQNFIQGARK